LHAEESSSEKAAPVNDSTTQGNPFKALDERIASIKESIANSKDEREKANLGIKLKMATEEKAKLLERLRAPYEKRIAELKARYEKDVDKANEELALIDKWVSGKKFSK